MMKSLLAFNIGLMLTFGVIHPEWNAGLQGYQTLVRVISIWLTCLLLGIYFADAMNGADGDE